MKASSVSPQSSEIDNVPAPRFHWGTRVALPLGLLAAFGALFAGSMASSLTPAVGVETVPVVERPAIRRMVAPLAADQDAVLVQAAGWIEPDPFTVYATALTDGTVEEVLILDGDSVLAGDVLARLVADDAQLTLHRAQVEDRAAREEWDANIDAQRDASVAAASLRETQAALGLARAELEVDRVLSREADRIHTRRSALAGSGSIAQEEVDTAEAASLAQSARVRVVDRRIEELVAKIDRVKAEDAAARKRLELRTEERHRLDLARVALAEAQLRVDRLEIRSPMHGVVMRRLVEPGSVVTTGSDNPEIARVAEIYDPRRLQVRVDVPLADAAQVGVGQRAQVIVEVLPDRTFSGAVTRIANRADIQKNTLEFKVALENPAPELKPDMLARVRFLATAQEKQAGQAARYLSVFAPAAAVESGGAWVVTEYDGQKGVAMRRTVTTTGAEENGWVEIESGLQPGDLLIVSSAEKLQPQQRVRTRKKGGE